MRCRTPRNNRERRLRRALRGTDGYAVQQAAWDAVLPEWRYCLSLINDRVVDRDGRYTPLTDKQRADLRDLSAALQADGRFLAPAWHCLLMQDLYRKCPGLGGWFPT